MRLLTILVVGVVAVLVMRALRQAGTRGAPPRSSEVPWDAYAVLGVGRGASAEEVTRAYRDLVKQYHPDRVADLGPELRQVAHRKTVEIQRAYAELTGH